MISKSISIFYRKSIRFYVYGFRSWSLYSCSVSCDDACLFKALLFLGSGSVIHGMHEEQDIQKMGGLKKYMPQTYITFLLGTIAISGIFPFSGFFSKDEILWNAYANGSPILWGAGVLAAFCTAFYMFRLLYLTFYGEERFDHHHVHPHESPVTMTLPLWILAILSVFGGLLGIPKALSGGADINILEHWLEPIFANANSILASHHTNAHHHSLALEWGLMAASLAIAIIGILYAASLYKNLQVNQLKWQQRIKDSIIFFGINILLMRFITMYS